MKAYNKETYLRENGFIELNNGYWIVEGQDPNNTIWYTIETGLEYIVNKDKNDIIAKINNTNQVDNVHEAIEFLSQRYSVSTTNEAKCIKLLIKHIKSTMVTYDRELLLTFLNDLKHCSSDSDDNVNLSEDSEFYIGAFMESTDYELFKK